MQARCLDDLSLDLFATVLSHVGVGMRPTTMELWCLSGVCTAFRTNLADDSLWQTLCKSAWSVHDIDLSSDWPQLASYCSLYAVLEVWAPRQGFYQVLKPSLPPGTCTPTQHRNIETHNSHTTTNQRVLTGDSKPKPGRL